MIGRTLDKYEILAEVGQGGMSVVYRGRDRELLREVAVKVLHPHLASYDEAKARFLREAQAVAKLRHDNILEIYDYAGAGSSESYIVTEFIHGRTLKDFVTEHKLAYPELAAMIVSELCAAVAHAHRFGVLHRDIKPENVMVRDDGRIKLMDFGIAQIVDAQRMTVTGQLLGSPAYMAPEHVEGKPLDFRTDVFSLGIVLYQLATGVLPFAGKNPHEILKKIGECQPRDAREVNPLISAPLGRVIAKALARDPAGRQQEARELAAELGQVLADAELGEPRDELMRFFANQASYTQALRQRLIDAYLRRGKAALAAGKRGAALELLNRVLTIDPRNDPALAELERLSRRRVGLTLLAVAGGAAILAGLGYLWHSSDGGKRQHAAAQALTPGLADAAPPAADAAPAQVVVDAGALPPDARMVPHVVDHGEHAGSGSGSALTPPPPDGASHHVLLTTQPKAAEVSVDGATPLKVVGGRLDIELGPGAHTLTVKNPFCLPRDITLPAGDPRTTVHASLTYLPRRLIVRCEGAQVISVDEKPVSDFVDIELGTDDSRVVQVEFLVEGKPLERKAITVRPGQGAMEVKCDGQ